MGETCRFERTILPMSLLISCLREGKAHATLEVYDADRTGFSLTAHKAGWVQTNLPDGRAYSCPECRRNAWLAAAKEDMGR
jgi:hypothetical protein